MAQVLTWWAVKTDKDRDGGASLKGGVSWARGPLCLLSASAFLLLLFVFSATDRVGYNHHSAASRPLSLVALPHSVAAVVALSTECWSSSCRGTPLPAPSTGSFLGVGRPRWGLLTRSRSPGGCGCWLYRRVKTTHVLLPGWATQHQGGGALLASGPPRGEREPAPPASRSGFPREGSAVDAAKI